MATLTEGLLENVIPVARYHGINTNKNVTIGGSAIIDLSGSTGAFKTPTGTTTLGGTTTGAVAITSSSATAGIGYATGAGGTVTQITSRATGVTLNKISGAITTDATSLAAGAEAVFTVTNSAVAIGDVVLVSLRSGATAGTSVPIVTAVAAGSFDITLTNLHATTADTGASIINFVVIKAVSA